MAFRLFNFDKPGPGVSKDEPPKPPFIRFWQIFFRKWTNFIKLNLLFLIPVVVVVALIYVINCFTTQIFICFLPLILLSPFFAGLTYVTRNYAREEHAFIFSDFKDAVKSNWKYFLINGVICYAVAILMMVSIPVYRAFMESNGWIFSIPLGISIAIGLLFLFAQFYIPLMIITLDLNLKKIYKNGFIFAILGLWRNLLLVVIFIAIAIINFILLYMINGLTSLIAIFLILLFGFSFTSFLINFTAYPLIDKMIIKPYYAKQNGEELSPDGKEENSEEQFEEKQSQYVFVNGRLVKKEDVEQENQVFND